LEFAIAKVQENHEGLKINGARQRVAHTDGVNLLKDNINCIQETQKPLRRLVYCKCSESWYLLMSQQQIQEKNYDRKIANKPFENVVKLKYLGLTLITFYSRENEVKGKGKVVLVQSQRHSQAVGLQRHLLLIWFVY
jgi:hypothetical protein